VSHRFRTRSKPPALTRHWRGELEAKTGIEAQSTDDARFRRDPGAFWREPGVVVASLALARSARHAPLVQAEQWDLVVVDEAHHLKNRATLAHRLVNGLKSRFLLLLTATPVETATATPCEPARQRSQRGFARSRAVASSRRCSGSSS
jgi:superfamily II DNA or RNA helicase